MALSANSNVPRAVDQELREFPVGAAVHIYRDGMVGMDPAGYLKAFEPGDRLIGVAYEESDNSSGSAAATQCRVRTQGDFEVTVTGAAQTSIGQAVYAISDDPITASQLLTKGHPDGFFGRVIDYVSANKALVRMKAFGEKPHPYDDGCIEIVSHFRRPHAVVNNTTAYVSCYGGGVFQLSTLGTGVGFTAGENGGCDLDQDAVDEAAQAGVYTTDAFGVDKGITFQCKLDIDDPGGANTDHDWGLVTLLTANSKLNFSHADVTDKACFHVDGNSANILAWTEKTGVEDTPVDTTVDYAGGTVQDFKIIVRPAGTVEFWIDNVRYLATTTFNGVATTAYLCGVVNNEKSATADAVSSKLTYLRVAGGES